MLNNMEKELIKLYEEYMEWLSEVKAVIKEDMGDNFSSFIRWLRIFRNNKNV